MNQKAALTHKKPDLFTRLAYGFGGLPDGIKNNGFDYFLLFFYSQILGLSAPLVFAALMTALVFDAISDPIVGYWSDNLRSRFGRRHPFMYAAMIPIGLAYYFVWNPPSGLEGNALFPWLLALTILTRLCFTMFEVPHNALAAELTEDYDARTSLMSFRYFFAWVGGLSIQIFLLFFMLKPSASNPSGYFNLPGWHAYGLLAGCLIFLGVLATSLGTHSHIPHLKSAPPKRKMTIRRVFGEIFETVSNPSFRALFLASLFGYLATGISASLNQYINGFFWGFTTTQTAGLTVAVYVSAVLALIIAPIAGASLGKKRAAIMIGLAAFTIAPAPVLAWLFGWLPEKGSPELYHIILFITVIDLALIIAYQMLAAAMIADIVEESELDTGRRSEGIFFAGISFIRKLAQGAGIFVATLVLSVAAIQKGAAPEDVSEQSLRLLGWGYALTLLTVWMLMIVCISFYRISKESHEKNLSELANQTASIENALD